MRKPPPVPAEIPYADIPVPDWIPSSRHVAYQKFAAVMGCKRAEEHFRADLDRANAKKVEEAQRQATILALPRDRRKRSLIKEQLAGVPEELGHIHSVFAFCGFPYAMLPAGQHDYVRDLERASLLISAGKAYNVDSGQWERMGVPYGAKARLVLAYLCSQSVKQANPHIDIGDSLGEFMEALGFSQTGGERGTIRPFKQQILNIAAADIRVGFKGNSPRAGETKRLNMFESFNVQFGEDPNQRLLWSNYVTFNAEFFRELSRHAQPLDWRVIRGLSGSARQIDIYIWLKYRANVLKNSVPLDWKALHRQFGAEIGRMADFRRMFLKDLRAVLELFDAVSIDEDDNGTLWLAPTAKRIAKG